MANDIDKALETIQSMLSTEGGRKTLQNFAGMLSNSDSNDSVNPKNDVFEAVEQNNIIEQMEGKEPDIVGKLGEAFGQLNHSNSKRGELLNALRPYLSSRKQGRFDTAMQIMQISNLPQMARFFNKK